MKRWGEAGNGGVDLSRLRVTLGRQQQRDAELKRIVAELVRDQPGNAEAVAAAGIAARAQATRSASMIELGAAAVDALQMAGYLDRARHAPGHVPMPAPAVETPAQSAAAVIPDDWAM